MNDELQRPATVAGVLLIPHEGDPLRLLEGGVGGSRPPIACHILNHWRLGPQSLSSGKALVLAWDGEAVPEGVDRAARSSRPTGAEAAGWPSCNIQAQSLLCRGSLPVGLLLVRLYRAKGLGRLVFVDEHGREVTS